MVEGGGSTLTRFKINDPYFKTGGFSCFSLKSLRHVDALGFERIATCHVGYSVQTKSVNINQTKTNLVNE